MSAKVGQSAQYFDSMGHGPFAAIVLFTAAEHDPEKGGEAPADGAVTLEYTRVKHGSAHRTVRTSVPLEDSPAHAEAAGAIGEDETVCGAPKRARFYRLV